MLLLGLATGLGYVVQMPETETVQAASSRRKLVELEAEYTNEEGDTLMVGETIARRDITVTGIYDDGSEAVIRSFAISPSTVRKEGENTIQISYNGLKTTVIIFGKKVESIEAEYVGEDVIVGQSVKKKDIVVNVNFSDGSVKENITNFTITSDVVRKEGENTLRVSYEGKSAEIYVYGIPPLAIEEIDAWYEGEGVIVGNAPDKSLIEAIAYYNDGSEKPITNYTLVPDTVTKVGTNRITLMYDSKKVVFEVEGLEKEVVSITAKYIGPPLEVGAKVNKNNVEVTATFNDGSKGLVTNFTIPSSKIYEIGLNEVFVECGDAEAPIYVRGVKAEYVDYSNAVTTEIKKDKTVIEMDFAVPYGYFSEDVKTVLLKNNQVSYAMKRAIGNSEYIACEIKLSDELEQELPLTLKVTLPKDWNVENFAVYYTTNGKTVAAKMNGEFLDDTTYEFKIFQQGMYAFVNTMKEMEEEETENKENTDNKENTENNENTEPDVIPVQTVTLKNIQDGKLTLKVGETYQLDVIIEPQDATDQKLYFTTTRKADVTVSETGLLTGVKEGVSLITIWVGENKDISTKVLVYVK